MALALLTPIPLEHLVDGEAVAASEGRVAFGSQAWEVFRELERESGPGTPVLIYASRTGGLPDLKVTWRARFLRYVESRGGAHPDGTRFRPPSTVEWREDEERYWAGFYEVESLHKLDEGEQLKIADLHDRRGKRYGRGVRSRGTDHDHGPLARGGASLRAAQYDGSRMEHGAKRSSLPTSRPDGVVRAPVLNGCHSQTVT